MSVTPKIEPPGSLAVTGTLTVGLLLRTALGFEPGRARTRRASPCCRPAIVNGAAGVVVRMPEWPRIGVVGFTVRGGRITTIDSSPPALGRGHTSQPRSPSTNKRHRTQEAGSVGVQAGAAKRQDRAIPARRQAGPIIQSPTSST
jgi:hypothetical protein